ncbi:MAG: hypothetical protein ACXV8O_05575 [Methylobacter sp.]
MTDTAFDEGKIEAMHGVIKTLNAQGIGVSIIALSTGLTEQEIEELK